MKVFVQIMFNEGRKQFAYVRRLLEIIDCQDGLADEDDILCGLYQRTFEANDPKLELLRERLRSEGIKWREQIHHRYSDDELRAIPLLVTEVDRDPAGEGRSTMYGTSYDMSKGCPRCGTGATQTSPLMLPLKGLPKKGEITLGCSWEILVGAKLRNALLDAKVTGVELRQAQFYRSNEPLPWWQVVSAYEMPRMSKKSKNLGRDTDPGWGCPVCLRDMHVKTTNEPLDYVYDRRDVDPAEIPDVVHTWECFGRSVLYDDPPRQLVRGFAQPAILIKPKVFDLFRGLKVKHTVFYPVRFV